MGKKDYQINVINAESIKVLNNEENKMPNQLSNENKPQDLKTGLMIGGLITFFITICFMVFTLHFLFQTYSTDNDVQKAVTFIVFILTVGWLSYIPGVISAIISLCLFPFVIKSTSKTQKVVGVIFTILSVLMILAFLAIAIFISALPTN